MAKDNQIALRINDRTNEAVEQFAEEYDYNNAEAVRIILKDRLAGQGYLDEPRSAMTDGGEITEKIEHTQEQVQKTRSEVGSLSREIQDFKSTTSKMLPSFFVSLLWIGIISAFELSPSVVAGSGIAMIALLFLSYYRVFNQ
jgi:hypothetical protein